jgi:DNA-binding HxlR family transcriptional regulator
LSQNPTSPLPLFATSFATPLLSELGAGPRSLAELRPALGSPPVTTARGYLRSLAAVGAVEKRRHGGFPGSFDYRLTAAGHDLVGVAEMLSAWLAASPSGRLPPGSAAARGAIRALCEAWRSGIVRALAAAPLSLAELDIAVADLSYPALKRRLATMRRLELVRVEPGSQERRPLAVDDWLRLAAPPLLAAARWERRWSPRPTSLTGRDVEAWLLLTLPPLRLPERVSGACRVTVRMADGALAGATAEVLEGAVVSCTPELAGEPTASVDGSLDAWISAILGRDPGGLELAGASPLAVGLIDGVRRYQCLS